MATLTSDISASQRVIGVTGSSRTTGHFRFRVDDELMDLEGFPVHELVGGYRRAGVDHSRWIVTRGVGGSTAATHSAGDTLLGVTSALVSGGTETPPAPWAGEAGGGGVTVDNQSDPPFEATTIIAPGATESAPGEATLASGEQTFRLLDSGVIAFNHADILTGVAMGTVEDGSVIYDIWYDAPTAWEGTGTFAPQMAIAGTDFTTQGGLDLHFDYIGGGATPTAKTSPMISLRDWINGNGGYGNLPVRVIGGGALTVSITNAGGASAGTIRMYALVAEPAS